MPAQIPRHQQLTQTTRSRKILPIRILYIVSLFPCWSETFIVREIHEMIRLGVDVKIISLKHAEEKMVQSDAALLTEHVVYPVAWWRSLFAAFGSIVRHPLKQVALLAEIFVSLGKHPGALIKTLVVWWRSLGLLDTVRDMRVDHIHAHWATYPSTSAMLIALRLKIPFSFTAHAHDIFLEDHLLAQKMSRAKFTVAISVFNKNYLAERVQGANFVDVRIVHCGVSPALFPLVTALRDPTRILAIGRLDRIKGFCHLIDACAILRDKGVAFACEVVGSGPLEAALAAQIRAHRLDAHVYLLGARKQEEIRQFLHRAAIFALPSVVTPAGDRDGIPVALMEAMASGLPVVSTRVSGIPELVEDGVTGLLADPADAASLAACIERLLTDRLLAAALAARARHHVEQEFDVQKEAKKLFDAIASSSRHA